MQSYFEWRELIGERLVKIDKSDRDFQNIASHFPTENSAEVVMERWLREKRITRVFQFVLIKIYRS